jgi:hypothetical protein
MCTEVTERGFSYDKNVFLSPMMQQTSRKIIVMLSLSLLIALFVLFGLTIGFEAMSSDRRP